MELLLLCIENCRYRMGDNQWLECKEGEKYRVLVNMDGVRFEYPAGSRHFSLPFYSSQIGKHFLSAFDKQTYDKTYRHITNVRLLNAAGDELLYMPEATIKTKP